MSNVKPFQIYVPDSKITRLRQKLALSDFPNEDTNKNESSRETGPPVSEVKRLSQVWQTDFDWRKVESRLNDLPHFTASVTVGSFGQFDIHFIHKKTTHTDAIPLLFLHGWPGSFLEVTKILDDLVKGDGSGSPTFHVIAPSLIDFGFSSASKKGFELSDHAEAYHKLMQTLGYKHYIIEAGDVGSLIARFIARDYGTSGCMAYHINTPTPEEPKKEMHPEVYAKFLSTGLNETELRGLERTKKVSQEGMGYYKLQSTKPLTIGYSLRDSPVGLLAWIYEKLYDWSDNYSWTDEEILTWVSIYYFSTAGPEAASNVYYSMEHCEPTAFAAAAAYIDVPLGIARFNNDLVLLPKIWNQTLGPIVFESEYENGGHFAAWERPDAIIMDLRSMFGDYGHIAKRLGRVWTQT